MDLELLLADDAVLVKRFDDGSVGPFGDLRIDFPFALDDCDGSFGILFGVAQAAIERAHNFLDFLRMFFDALLGRGVTIARELDHVADERDFVEAFALENRVRSVGHDDGADRSRSKRRHADAFGADLDEYRVLLRFDAVVA